MSASVSFARWIVSIHGCILAVFENSARCSKDEMRSTIFLGMRFRRRSYSRVVRRVLPFFLEYFGSRTACAGLLDGLADLGQINRSQLSSETAGEWQQQLPDAVDTYGVRAAKLLIAKQPGTLSICGGGPIIRTCFRTRRKT